MLDDADRKGLEPHAIWPVRLTDESAARWLARDSLRWPHEIIPLLLGFDPLGGPTHFLLDADWCRRNRDAWFLIQSYYDDFLLTGEPYGYPQIAPSPFDLLHWTAKKRLVVTPAVLKAARSLGLPTTAEDIARLQQETAEALAAMEINRRHRTATESRRRLTGFVPVADYVEGITGYWQEAWAPWLVFDEQDGSRRAIEVRPEIWLEHPTFVLLLANLRDGGERARAVAMRTGVDGALRPIGETIDLTYSHWGADQTFEDRVSFDGKLNASIGGIGTWQIEIAVAVDQAATQTAGSDDDSPTTRTRRTQSELGAAVQRAVAEGGPMKPAKVRDWIAQHIEGWTLDGTGLRSPADVLYKYNAIRMACSRENSPPRP